MATNGNTRVTRKGRPNYPIDFKRRLAVMACELGISVAKLALDHGINTNLLFKWRRHYRAGWFGELESDHLPIPGTQVFEMPNLLPVMTVSPAATPAPAPVAANPVATLEIVIGAATVRVLGDINRDALRTVLDWLAERA